ncbi:MAG TPA: N-acetyltransferase, partial [Amycolatopsis sp.]|nr:N-acetyltransferase [Amycolatopsis sp.]
MTETGVALRPVYENDLPMLEALTNDPLAAGAFEWHGWHDPRFLRRRWAETGMLAADNGMLMIDLDGQRLGFV